MDNNENKNYIVLTDSTNIGLGFWTAICIYFCMIFGKESKNLRYKQMVIGGRLKNLIEQQYEKLPAGEYDLVDYRIQFSSMLSATATAVAVRKHQ